LILVLVIITMLDRNYFIETITHKMPSMLS
jgi:hypothetical protein